MRALVAATAALVLMASPSLACEWPINRVLDGLEAGTAVHVFRGDRAKVVIEAFNAEPPPTSIAGDEVLVQHHSAGQMSALVIMDQGCAVYLNVVPTPILRDFVARAVRGAS